MIQRLPLTEFLPFVMLGCPGVPEPIAIAAIRLACIDFCQRSGWLERKTRIDQQKHVCEYPVWPDENEAIARLKEVKIGCTCYTAATDSCCFDHCGTRFTVARGMLKLSKAPVCDEKNAIQIWFAAKPTQLACDVDASLFNDWHEAILNGTLARLYAVPGREWSSESFAETNRQNFNADISTARVQVLRGHSDANVILQTPAII